MLTKLLKGVACASIALTLVPFAQAQGVQAQAATEQATGSAETVAPATAATAPEVQAPAPATAPVPTTFTTAFPSAVTPMQMLNPMVNQPLLGSNIGMGMPVPEAAMVWDLLYRDAQLAAMAQTNIETALAERQIKLSENNGTLGGAHVAAPAAEKAPEQEPKKADDKDLVIEEAEPVAELALVSIFGQPGNLRSDIAISGKVHRFYPDLKSDTGFVLTKIDPPCVTIKKLKEESQTLCLKK